LGELTAANPGAVELRSGEVPKTDRKTPTTMNSKAHNWAACRRLELERDRAARRQSEAIAARRRLHLWRMDRAGVKTDRFGPSDPRFAYLTRSYD
jgi:hypothetical protein